MRFQLHISLGNDAMKTPRDIAAALHKIADELDATYAGQRDEGPDGWNDDITEQDALAVTIRDENGNTVGNWKIEQEPKTEGAIVQDLVIPRDDRFVLGYCPHGVNLDRDFCDKGCRV